MRTRTEKFIFNSYPDCISEWNKLDPETRLAPSVAVFKRKLLSIIRPPPNSVFGIYDRMGISYLSQVRVGLIKLSFHKFKYKFRDTINSVTVLRTRNTCCFALHLLLNDKIFSLEFLLHYDHSFKSTAFLTTLFYNFCYMVMDSGVVA